MDGIAENRNAFLSELKSGNRSVGCQKSDEQGLPVFEKESDKNGAYACAIMGIMYGNVNGRISLSTAAKALGLKSGDCRYI